MISFGIRKSFQEIKRLAGFFRFGCPKEEILKDGICRKRRKRGRMLKSLCSKIRICVSKMRHRRNHSTKQSGFHCCWEPLVTSYSLRFRDVEGCSSPVVDLTSSSTRDTQCTRSDSIHFGDSLVASFQCNELTSRENGICQNCRRTFRLRWSRFQDFCNLDCKTASRLRHDANSPSTRSSMDVSLSYSCIISKSI